MTPVVFIASRKGNHFFREMAVYLAESLSSLGRTSYSLALDGFDELPLGVCNIIVAPHEFVWFGGLSGREHVLAERNCCVLVTESPSGLYWEMSWKAARFASGVFDLDPISVTEFERRGIGARLLQLGYNPDYDLSHEGKPRTRDVFFAGSSWMGDRAAVLAEICERLPEERRWIHVQEEAGPVRQGEKTGFVFGSERARQIAQSLVGLDMISGNQPYLNQFRYFHQYVSNGALIFTDHPGPIDLLEPEVDFVSVPISEYVETLFYWLAQPHRIELMATRARERFIAERSISQTLRWLVTFDFPVTPPHRSIFLVRRYPTAAFTWRSKSGTWLGGSLISEGLRQVWHAVRNRVARDSIG